MKIQVPIVLVMIAVLTLPVAADPLPVAKPAAVGMSSQRLERIGQTLRIDIDKGRMPGAVVAIARKGKLVYYEAFGFLDKPGGIPMRKDAIFNIASMTKPMTSVVTMLLVEEGRLFLNDPVSAYLPPLGRMPVAVMKTDASGQTVVDAVPAKRVMTIQDLMRHTSGLTYGGRGDTAVHKMYPASSGSASRDYTGTEFIEKLGTLPLLHQPGTAWDYSFSTDVLGLVVEAITKQSLGQFLDARVIKPLAMIDTGFIVPPEKVSRYAKALPNDPDTGKPQSVGDATKPTKFECGGACAVSTASDYIRFTQMLLNRGKLGSTQILGRKSVELMVADHLGPEIQNNIEKTDPTRAGYGFGLGFAVRRASGISPLLGSPGDFTWGGAAGTNFWVDTKEELIVVFMAHTPGPTRLHYRKLINALALQALVD